MSEIFSLIAHIRKNDLIFNGQKKFEQKSFRIF
jgi:hypothetical protein